MNPTTPTDGISNNGRIESTTDRSMGEYKKPLKLKLKEGALHRMEHVKKGEKIPASKLAVNKDDSPLEKKRKQFALNAKSWKH